MEITVDICVHNSENITKNKTLKINSNLAKNRRLATSNLIAYPPFINSHDHLISNWFPKAGDGKIYQNVEEWVEDMKFSDSFLERNKIWINDGKFDLTDERAILIIQLGVYKNIFSGCAIVQDHIPKQKSAYYQNNPITILKNYAQCHSISMGNWWGGQDAKTESKNANGKIPFVVHLAEGKDKTAQKSFTRLENMGLLQPNTLLIHCIALTENEIKKCAENGTSICWCPESNFYLIGKTLDVNSCLKHNVNVVLGTDSTMSGSLNLFEEFKYIKHCLPQIPAKKLFEMITVNAQKALMLDKSFGVLNNQTADLLLLPKKDEDPFENLLHCDINDIELFICNGIPLYGNTRFLDNFDLNLKNYYQFGNKFVIGHPEKILSTINSKLGYKKSFPFLPI